MEILEIEHDDDREWLIKRIEHAWADHIERRNQGTKPMSEKTRKHWSSIVDELQAEIDNPDKSYGPPQEIEVYNWMALAYHKAITIPDAEELDEYMHPGGCPDSIGCA